MAEEESPTTTTTPVLLAPEPPVKTEEPKVVISSDASSNTAGAGYWDFAENLKTTLSSASLSGLGKSLTKKKEQESTIPAGIDNDDNSSISSNGSQTSRAGGGNYWEWKETLKKTLSSVSLGNLRKKDAAEESPPPPPPINYWNWRNSFRSKSDLLAAEKEKGDGEPTDGGAKAEEQNSQSGGSYWFWRNPSMKSLSNVSLSNLGKDQSRPDATDASSDDAVKKVGPITALDHRLRSSWRKSFHQLSSNSLSKLDESKQTTTWRDSFRSFQKNSRVNLRKEDSQNSLGSSSAGMQDLSISAIEDTDEHDDDDALEDSSNGIMF